jgi:hypothetical protein
MPSFMLFTRGAQFTLFYARISWTISGPKNDVIVLGWVVSWNNKRFGNSQSATSWSGIYYPDEDIIRTQWMLTSYENCQEYRNATTINHDEFRRAK